MNQEIELKKAKRELEFAEKNLKIIQLEAIKNIEDIQGYIEEKKEEIATIEGMIPKRAEYMS